MIIIITIINGLSDRNRKIMLFFFCCCFFGGVVFFVSHDGRKKVDYFAVSDELSERKSALSIAERFQSKHFPVEMEVDPHAYVITAYFAKEND